jgi:hypothetical protein
MKHNSFTNENNQSSLPDPLLSFLLQYNNCILEISQVIEKSVIKITGSTDVFLIHLISTVLYAQLPDALSSYIQLRIAP